MPNYQEFALRLIEQNPQLANNPRSADLINIIRNNDEKRGIQVAQNILQEYGISAQDGIKAVLSAFHF